MGHVLDVSAARLSGRYTAGPAEYPSIGLIGGMWLYGKRVRRERVDCYPSAPYRIKRCDLDKKKYYVTYETN